MSSFMPEGPMVGLVAVALYLVLAAAAGLILSSRLQRERRRSE